MTDHFTLERAAPGHRVLTASDTMTSDTTAAFAELICADAGLVHVEFDAIIAANFPPGAGQRNQGPPRRPRPPVLDRPRPAAPPILTTATAQSPAASSSPVGTQLHHCRERSPPTNRR
jgi:hypothetical protein